MKIIVLFLTNKLTIFVGVSIATVLSISGVVYYITPYHHHALVPIETNVEAQPGYALLFGIISVIGLIAVSAMVVSLTRHPENR